MKQINNMNFKNYYLTFIIILVFNTANAQNGNTWQLIDDLENGISFSVTENPEIYDTLGVKMYSSPIDSILSLQVHICDFVGFDPNNPLFENELERQNGDTLRTIASLIVLSTNSEISSIENVQKNAISGIELGITYKTLAANSPIHTILQYFIYDQKFVSFTISGLEEDLDRLIINKQLFFDSIAFN